VSAQDVEIVAGYRPGALGRLVEMHGAYYAREWGFGAFFEAKVAAESAAYFQRYDTRTDCAWFVFRDSKVIGSMIIDGGEAGAAEAGGHLRWFILDDGCRGLGLGNDLMRRALEFCDARAFSRIYLTTFAGLDAARALYERHGFCLTGEKQDRTWGRDVTEQRFERPGLASSGAPRNM